MINLNFFSTKPKSNLGFTFIELLVVISIIAILLTAIIATFGTAQQKGRDSRRKQDLDAIKKALELFKSDTVGNKFYPSSIYADLGGGVLTLEGGNYIKKTPVDPSINAFSALGSPTSGYLYLPKKKDGSACTVGNNTPSVASTGDCVNYSLYTCLENSKDQDADPTGQTVLACTAANAAFRSYHVDAP